MKLNKQDLTNILMFLDRVETRGITEAMILTNLAIKIEAEVKDEEPEKAK